MKKSQFCNELNVKNDVKSIFLIKHIAVMSAKDGRDYLNVILSDKSGDMEARKWNGAQEVVKTVSRGSYAYVTGKVNQFQGRKQVIVNDITAVDENEVEASDYISKAMEAPEKMYEELLAIVDKLDDVYIRDLLKNVLFDPEISRRLKIWPAGKTIHHAYQSGLLEHILSCTTLGDHLSPHYKVNKNYVVAGCILHDLCKIYELSSGPIVDYTEEGKLVGHLVKGLEIVDHYASKINNFPYQTKMHLKHILLSHHGEYEYGSPKIPQTSEAFLVHLIDMMDSKMGSLETIKKNDNNTGHWSGFVRHLDRIVFKDELPFNSEYISDERPEKAPKKKDSNSELKDSPFANALKDFKVD